MVKIDKSQYEDIRNDYINGMTTKQIAKKYKTTTATISRILRDKSR